MARVSDAREAASKFIDEYADYDEEYEFHQELIADETFGTLAHCRHELDIQARYSDAPNTDVEDHADAAVDELRAAMDARAEQVREEGDH